MPDFDLDLLEQLCAIHAVSGREDRMTAFIRDRIRPLVDEVSVDNLGNVVGILKGTKYPDYRLMLQAHMDELGLIIRNITEDGFLKIYDHEKNEIIKEIIDHTSYIFRLGVSQMFLVTGSDDKTIKVYLNYNFKLHKTLNESFKIEAIYFSHKEDLFAVGSTEGHLKIYSSKSFEVLKDLEKVHSN